MQLLYTLAQHAHQRPMLSNRSQQLLVVLSLCTMTLLVQLYQEPIPARQVHGQVLTGIVTNR